MYHLSLSSIGGTSGLAAVPNRVEEFKQCLELSLQYCVALKCKLYVITISPSFCTCIFFSLIVIMPLKFNQFDNNCLCSTFFELFSTVSDLSIEICKYLDILFNVSINIHACKYIAIDLNISQ